MKKCNFLPILFTFIFLFINYVGITQCTGAIFTSGPKALGNSAVLNPNGDAKIFSSNALRCKDDYLKFVSITKPTGCSSCQKEWSPMPGFEINSDLLTGSNCGPTDIVGDTLGANLVMGYYSVVDFNGVCNDGDEIIAFRVRLASEVNGAFSFSMLFDTDGLLGTNDPEGYVCGNKITNAGFEREIQVATGGANIGVSIWDINGTVGVQNLVHNYPLSSNAQQARACSSECGCRLNSSGTPAYITFFVKLSDLGVDCNSYPNVHVVPTSSSSTNSIVGGDNSISDVGGASNTLANCPACPPVAPGCSQAGWDLGCLLLCSAGGGGVLGGDPFPVNFLSFTGKIMESNVVLQWKVSESINQSYFEIERSTKENDYEVIGSVEGDNQTGVSEFSFIDYQPLTNSLYRIKSIDYDGKFIYSPTIAISEIPATDMVVFADADYKNLYIRQYSATASPHILEIYNMEGIKIYTQPFNCDAGINVNSFELPTTPKGIYLIQVSDLLKVEIQRIVW